jgi:hypothetical protein
VARPRAPGADPADDPADGAPDDPAPLADAGAVGGAELLPLQPASAPSPSSTDIVSVIALARVCRCVLMSE